MQNCSWTHPRGAFDSALFANNKSESVFPHSFSVLFSAALRDIKTDAFRDSQRQREREKSQIPKDVLNPACAQGGTFLGVNPSSLMTFLVFWLSPSQSLYDTLVIASVAHSSVLPLTEAESVKSPNNWTTTSVILLFLCLRSLIQKNSSLELLEVLREDSLLTYLRPKEEGEFDVWPIGSKSILQEIINFYVVILYFYVVSEVKDLKWVRYCALNQSYTRLRLWVRVCCSYLFVHSRVSTFLCSSLFSLEQVSTLWSDSSTAGSVTERRSFISATFSLFWL